VRHLKPLGGDADRSLMRVAIYARVSTGEQSVSVQTEELRAWLEANGHEVVAEYTEVISGAKRARRFELDSMLNAVGRDVSLRPGAFEAVAVVKLDRLARSTQHLIELSASLEASGVDLMVKDQAIDTSTPAGKLMFHMLAAIAEFERDLIRERTRAGMAHAKRRGAPIGRPKRALDMARAEELRALGMTVTEIATQLGVPRTTLGDALARAS
jgi:DNA invertase Pin-like site-specific DNA recombinase